MLKGKQRSYLKSLANGLKPTLVIGKQGVSENTIKEIDQQLEANELVKISLLDSSGLEAGEVIEELADKMGAEYVSQLGSKMVLYRASQKNPKIELPK